MAEREKVIKALENARRNTLDAGIHRVIVTHEVLDSIIDLLKEQEMVKQCKDCKFYTGTNQEFAMCLELDICVDSDFSCKYWRSEGR